MYSCSIGVCAKCMRCVCGGRGGGAGDGGGRGGGGGSPHLPFVNSL